MLVNLTPNQKEIDRRYLIAKENDFVYTPQNSKELMQYGVGIYQCNFAFNFSHNDFLEFNIDENVFNIPFDQSYELFKPDYRKAQYGVADSIDQLKEYFKEEIEDAERKYFIEITPVFQDKENKGKSDGWRWHKWGEYIGKLDTQCEYLDDEDFGEDFEYVLCYHIYEVK